jgi:hypothetical protein
MSLARLLLGFLMLAILSSSTSLHAQKPPTDLTDLDIEEILSLHINRVDFERWHVGYRFLFASFDGYRDGTTDLDLDEVLGPPPTGRFPVTPTVITQQAHMVDISYNVSQELSLALQLPFIRQSSDHESIIVKTVNGVEYNFSEFNITSSGVGDIALSGSYLHRLANDQRVLASVGVNLPTGSIEEKGLTPRDPPNNTLLPFTMQIGSGTLDLTPTLAYSHRSAALRLTAFTSAVLRMGKNDHDYTLGNRFALGGSVSYKARDWAEPFVRVSYKTTGSIDGVNEDLVVPAPPPCGDGGCPGPVGVNAADISLTGAQIFPAPVTNPALFGGQEVELRLGSKIKVNKGLQERFAVDVEYGLPIYQSLNGPQPKELGRIGLSATATF